MAHTCASFLRCSIKDINQSLIKRETTVTKLCNESLRLIDQTKNLNSFITICREDALEKARLLDEQISRDDSCLKKNPLFGIPISIKDNFCTDNVLTTCGSKMLHNFVPPYSATVVNKLSEANSIMTGKTNMDEFAMGSSSTTSYYGPASNFWKSELSNGKSPGECNPSEWYMAGGSSTGSAVSVASGACFASLGTDTGGSTRQPASLTGVIGFKPTYGLISRFGLVPLVHCLDVVSILARTVDDVRLIFEAIVGLDDNDLTSVDHKVCLKDDKINTENGTTRTICIGVPEEFVSRAEVSEDVLGQYSEFLKQLSSQSNGSIKYKLKKLKLPHASLATECYTVISSAEIASNMSCYDGVKFGYSTDPQKFGCKFDRDVFFKANRDEGFGSEVKKRILLGNYFLLSENREKYLMQALKLRRLISEEFEKAFNEEEIDVILMPSTPTTSVTYEDWLRKQDDNKLFREDYFLIPSNLANLPSISMPIGVSNKGLPIGMQLVAKKFQDLDLLSISKLFEIYS